MSDSLRPHESQHARPPCPSPTPGVYSNSCPSSWWCHPAISSSVIPFSSHLQSFPASGSFLMTQFFVSGGQSIGVSASFPPLIPYNTEGPLDGIYWVRTWGYYFYGSLCLSSSVSKGPLSVRQSPGLALGLGIAYQLILQGFLFVPLKIRVLPWDPENLPRVPSCFIQSSCP